MDYLMEKLLEKNLNKYLLEGKYDGNHNYIIIKEEYISSDNRKINENKIKVHIDDKDLKKNLSKKYNFKWEEERPFRYKTEIKVDYYPRSVYSDDDEYAFRGILLECKRNKDGVLIIPELFKYSFKDCFPKIEFVTERGTLEFVEYTGGYPARCSGETILKYGETIIRTYILKHRVYHWELEIPRALENLKLPKEIYKIIDDGTSCCGGCD